MGTDNIENSDAAERSATSRRRFLGATGVGAAGIWAAPQLMSAASAQGVVSQPPPPPCTVYGERVVNGGFESGDLFGWTAMARAKNNVGPTTDVVWSVESSATVVSAQSGSAIPPTTVGAFQAVVDEIDLGSAILFQDVSIPADACSARLRLEGGYNNTDPLCPFTPSNDLEVDNIINNNDPQSFRIDLMDPLAANPFSTQPADVLIALFRTLPGDPNQGVYSIDVDLSAYKGQTVRIRAGIVISCNYLVGTMDNVRLEA